MIDIEVQVSSISNLERFFGNCNIQYNYVDIENSIFDIEAIADIEDFDIDDSETPGPGRFDIWCGNLKPASHSGRGEVPPSLVPS
jgi:hypothetical protein